MQKSMSTENILHPMMHMTNKRERLFVKRKVSPKIEPDLLMKVLRMVICVVFLLISVYQCSQSIDYYQSDPSDTISRFVVNTTITFPLVLICPYALYMEIRIPSVNPALYARAMWNTPVTTNEEAFDILGTDGMWNISALDMQTVDYVLDYVRMKPGSSPYSGQENISTSKAIFGSCTILHEKYVTRLGLQTKMGIIFQGQNSALGGYLVYFCSSEDLELMKYTIFNNGMLYQHDGSWEIIMRATQLIYRNTKLQPCEENGKLAVKCIVNCLEKEIYRNVKEPCRLPFMQEVATIPPCPTLARLTEVVKALMATLHNFVPEECDCLKKCKETVYSMQATSSVVAMASSPGYTRVLFFFGDTRITLIEQKATYGLIDLCAAIGGSVGLFLGMGALQLYDIIIEVLSKMGKR